VAVYDRWHVASPEPGAESCRCRNGRGGKLYPSADHLKGKRWQVQWEDPNAPGRKRLKRNFELKDGDNPNLHAAAYDKHIQGTIVARTYTDPGAGDVTLKDYAETWRKGRGHDVNQAAAVERRLRLHVYEGEPGSGLTPRGAPAIGQHTLAVLDRRPSLSSAWISAMPLAQRSALHVVTDVSACLDAALDDGAVRRNPLKADSVRWPSPGRTRARPWTAGQVAAMRGELPGLWQVVPDLGAGTGMRQGEMFGLGVDDVDWLVRKDPRVRVVRALKIVGNELRFGPLKNRKVHSVPLAPLLKEKLSRHLDQYPAREVTLPWHDPRDRERHGQPVTVRLVLSTGAGMPVDRPLFDRCWRAARKRAGITPADGRARDDGCHALRHTFASLQLRQGVDIVRVAAWLGDTVAVVADTYAHLMPGDDDSDGAAAVDSFFRSCALDVPAEGPKGKLVQAAGDVPHV
jgi:integrase